MSSAVRVQAIVSFKRIVALFTVERSSGQMCLHVSGEKCFLDEHFRAVEALKLSLGCVSSNVVKALILVLEKNSADMTSELFNVGVLKMMNAQALLCSKTKPADFTIELLFLVNHLMRAVRILVRK